MSSKAPSRFDRGLFFRRAAIAPACLCLVAVFHVVRVWSCSQTPWKGGGFGMFSTVDGESARFLRCYLVGDGGELPLGIRPAAEKTVSELRAAPTQAGLDELAQRLAEQSWRWRSRREASEAAAIQALHGQEISYAVLRPTEGRLAAPEPSNEREYFLEPIPRDEGSLDAIEFQEIRLECWRYRYDSVKHLLRAELMLSSRAKAWERQESAP